MRVFRGNCQQIAIFESMLRATGQVMKVEGGDTEPMFSVEQTNTSTTFYRKLLVKTDNSKSFLPKVYYVSVRYDLISNKGQIYLTREVIEFLKKTVPDIERIIAAGEINNNEPQ